MGLIKTRPTVRLRVPREIHAGDRFSSLVILECRRPVEVEFVDVVLTGRERWGVGSGSQSRSQSQVPARLAARLSDARELPKGRTELPVEIPLPAHCPPTYRGVAALVDYDLSVHVSVPWWPDRRAGFEVHVAPAPVASPASAPQVFSTNPDGPRSTEPHVEMSLSSQWTRAGDTVTGAFALFNTDHNRYSEVHAALVGTEQLWYSGSPYVAREYMRYQIRLGVEEVSDGEMIPFRFRLPEDAMAQLAPRPRPGQRHGLVSLSWSFELKVGVRWANDLTLNVPFAVLPRSARPGDAPSRLAPPAIGSDRLRAVWEAVGQPLGLRYRMQQLEAEVGETELKIRRDHLGRDGIHLVVELRYPELHLGLEVEPATKVQQLVGGGEKIGIPGWDRAHYVRARDASQVTEVLRRVVPRIENAKLRRMDDTRLVVQVRDAGQSQARLARLAEAALGLARELEALRVALPPPPQLAPALAEWRALATQLGAPLETARMRIEGQLSTLTAEVRVAFDESGEPFRTWLSVAPSTPLDEEHRFRVTVAEPEPVAQIAARFEGEAAELVKAIANGAVELSIEPERLSLCLPAPLGLTAEPPWIDTGGAPPPSPHTAASIEQRLGRMGRLAGLLRGQAGPYR